ncbi:MAG: ACP phosphodiesterase [Marinilabiliaceae bacterium]
MNYLAHLYLSGDDPEILVGNFIGDYVKGRRFTRYNASVRTGILLHRHIDTFTDRHPVFRESSALLKPIYNRYSGVVTDIVYDHLLAAHWSDYSDVALHTFVKHAHRILMRHYFGLPGQVKQFLPFLIKSRRLETYQTFEGVEKTLNIMSSHSSLPQKTPEAMLYLEKHYDELYEQFARFMPEIVLSTHAFLATPDRFYSFDHPTVS